MRKLRQKDYCKVKANLDYLVSSSPPWLQSEILSQCKEGSRVQMTQKLKVLTGLLKDLDLGT